MYRLAAKIFVVRKARSWNYRNSCPTSANASKTPWCVFDLAKLEAEARQLESETLKADFWSDPNSAQTAMRRLAYLNDTVGTWRGLADKVGETEELAELAQAEADEEMLAHVTEEAEAVEMQLDRLEMALAFNGPYDSRNAIFAVHAGAGGTESQDWAEMLLRMYLRWCELHGFDTEVLDLTPGEGAGIKSATVEVQG